jgi:hypothetical protein
MNGPVVLEYSLTQEEASVAASRAAWRASLQGGLLAQHVAPLVTFALALLFTAVLGWTGLIARRTAEIGLIVAAAAYMSYRLWSRRRFFAERRAANVWVERLRAAAPLRLTLDEATLSLEAGRMAHQWRFADGLEIEEVAGLVYVWPKRGAPLIWPIRAHGDPDEAAWCLATNQRRARAHESAPSAMRNG